MPTPTTSLADGPGGPLEAKAAFRSSSALFQFDVLHGDVTGPVDPC